LPALLLEANNYYEVGIGVEDLAACEDPEEVFTKLAEEAIAQYQAKCEDYPGGLETAQVIERDVMLQIIDQRWRDHLSEMDHLRDGIHLRAMAQQDPLVAWQRDGFQMFEYLLGAIDEDFVRFVTHVDPQFSNIDQTDDALAGATTNAPSDSELVTSEPPRASAPKADPNAKVGRNDPCPCGSGRKYKQCHGRP
jgi:preprotein translocase subunit SecA